jgi:hypothetical protein
MRNSAYVIEIEQAEKETRRSMLNTRHKIATQITQISQLTNNWNVLVEWLKEQKEDANKCIVWNKNKNQYYDEYKRDIARFDFILDKMKEIKDKNDSLQ